jgi:hypothetical protein
VLEILRVGQLQAKKLKVKISLLREDRRIEKEERRSARMGQVYNFTKEFYCQH